MHVSGVMAQVSYSAWRIPAPLVKLNECKFHSLIIIEFTTMEGIHKRQSLYKVSTKKKNHYNYKNTTNKQDYKTINTRQ